jgi:hypothetical protein
MCMAQVVILVAPRCSAGAAAELNWESLEFRSPESWQRDLSFRLDWLPEPALFLASSCCLGQELQLHQVELSGWSCQA